jgi:maltose O-acetyltransferase
MPYCLQSLWLRLAGIQIGKKSAIHRGVRFLAFGNCTIGSGCIVNADCILDNRAGLCIGDNVSISNGCAIYSMGHDLDSPTFAMKGKTISIGDYACLFARALVMPGVVIGKGAVVCSGSVVVKSVEEFTVVGGNPAKFVKKRPLEHPSYRLNGRFYLST